MISHTVILSVLINLLESISQYDVSHSDIFSINKPTLLESISQYDISHSDIVSINKPTGKYQVSIRDASQKSITGDACCF